MIRYKFLFYFCVFFLFCAADSSSGTQYVAFSLKVAQERITSIPKGEDYRKLYPEVFTLGGITAISGLVYARNLDDPIIVGERNPERAPLTLDDLVVALRARFIHGKWPLVSIDPTPETKKSGMQIVRFEGGVEDTQFGEDLFSADCQLKKIALGRISPQIGAVKSYFDLGMEEAKQGINKQWWKGSRFWFYPVISHVPIREDVVSIKGLKVSVFTEVIAAEIDGTKIEYPSTFQDVTGDRFAKMVSDNFEKLASIHPPFQRLQGLNEIVALTMAIEKMDKKPDLIWWLKDYRIKEVKTLKAIAELKRIEEYEAQNGLYRGYWGLSGGIQLMAIALRLKAGDVTSLKEAVLKTRPKTTTLSWGFVVAEWLIPTSPVILEMFDIAALFSQAAFLYKNKRYDDAIVLYTYIINLKPEYAEAYGERGNSYDVKGQYDLAMFDYNKVLEINPNSKEAYNNRGIAHQKKGQYTEAIADYTKAIEINHQDCGAYSNRGNAYIAIGEYYKAIEDFNKAIEINPRYDDAYNGRGSVYASQGEYTKALMDFNRSIEINPIHDKAYSNRGNIYFYKDEYEKAFSDFNKALEINPTLADAYHGRGSCYHKRGQYSLAVSDLTRALEIDPRNFKYLVSRGNTYTDGAEYEKAIKDFDKAIDMSPTYAKAYCNRGRYNSLRHDYDKAISDYNRALEIDPRLAVAYNDLAVNYYFNREYAKAWDNVHKAQGMNYQVQPGFLDALRKASGRQR